MKVRLLGLLAATATVAGPLAHAQNYNLHAGLQESAESGPQIGWASEAFAQNLRADGTTTFEESGEPLQAQLGAFKTGFDPATSDFAAWTENWVPLQTANYDPIDQQFIATATLGESDGVFAEGQPAWIWVYDSKALDGQSEWLLVSAATWRWPAASSPLPTIFSMSEAQPEDAIVGAVNDPGGKFHMQLQVVVPEPSVALLASVLGLAPLVRRRRC